MSENENKNPDQLKKTRPQTSINIVRRRVALTSVNSPTNKGLVQLHVPDSALTTMRHTAFNSALYSKKGEAGGLTNSVLI